MSKRNAERVFTKLRKVSGLVDSEVEQLEAECDALDLAMHALRRLREEKVALLEKAYVAQRLAHVRAAVGEEVRYMACGNELGLQDGTLKSVRGSKGTVDFGALGLYNIPLVYLRPSKELRKQ